MTFFIAVILENRNLADLDELERTNARFCKLRIMVISDSFMKNSRLFRTKWVAELFHPGQFNDKEMCF